MVSSQLLGMIRATAERFLTQRCTIDRETSAKSAYGGPTHAREVVYSNEPCRLILPGQRTQGAVDVVGAAEVMRDEYRLIVRRSVALTTDMRVTVDGVEFSITRIETSLTDEAFHAAIVERRL